MSWKKNFYIVSEIQSNDGAKAVVPIAFDNEDEEIALNQAYSRYYTILASAAVSDIEYHGANIVRSDGIQIEAHIFDRRPVEPAPEPEPQLSPEPEPEDN